MITNFIHKKILFKKNYGFTVLESIVAIFVMSVAISGAFTAVQSSLSQSTMSKEEVKAFYLAQEAVEIVRNRRDSNQLMIMSGASVNWLSQMTEVSTDACYFGKVCMVESSFPSTFLFCGNSWNTCPNLRQNSTTYLAGYNSTWPLTNFKREIMFESISANEVAVVVRVTWTKGLTTREFKVKTLLFNWI